MSKCVHWEPILTKFQSRLSHWRATLLSYGGRLVLCKSVLGSLGLYFFSIYKAPEKVLKLLESYRNSFFWGTKPDQRKITWIAWKDVMASSETGGLGINSLKAQNLSLLSKWWWRLKNEGSSLWKKVITSIHGTAGGLSSIGTTSQRKIGGVWGAIAGIHRPFASLNINLSALFSHCSITVNGNTTQRWTWLLESSGEFSTASLRRVTDSSLLQNQAAFITKWCHLVPSKVNILAWRIQHSRLPTRVNIDYRGIDIGTTLCPICEKYVETEEHLFIRCEFARMILRAMYNWWGMTFPEEWSIAAIFREDFMGLSGHKLQIFRAVFYVHFWYIWNSRNAIVFSNKKEPWTVIADRVQAQSFFWINSRRGKKKNKLQWINWCSNPLDECYH